MRLIDLSGEGSVSKHRPTTKLKSLIRRTRKGTRTLANDKNNIN